MSFKVFALNVKSATGANLTIVRNILTAMDADIVCLTESGNNPFADYYTNNPDKRYPYVLQNSSYDAILSKTPLSSLYGAAAPQGDSILYYNPYPANWPNNHGMNNRSCGAKTTIGGQDLYVVAVHLDSNNYFSKPLNEYQADGATGPQRRGQVRAILQTIATLCPTLPVVMAGDFNCASHFDWSWWTTPYPPTGHGGDTTAGPAGTGAMAAGKWCATMELSNAGYHDALKDTFKQVVTGDIPRSTWLGTLYTPVGYQHERIDMIWYKGAMTPTAGDTMDQTNTPGITTWPTDHRGVITTLTF